jgi:hypothetical protein
MRCLVVMADSLSGLVVRAADNPQGWLERVWEPGIAYDHAPDDGPIVPRLTGLRETRIVAS